ncbi:MAG: DeoR/GlpR family DNA-binding transcription regulator [Propioniciclava sp.]
MHHGSSEIGRAAYAEERHEQILHLLRSEGRVNAADLASRLEVTGETIRKDLIQLERRARLRRVHGGAVPAASLSFEPTVSVRTEYTQEKARIARAALRHLPSSGTIIIDAGSTTEKFASLLPADQPLTVYTNSLPIALAAVTKPAVTVFTLGGRLRSRTLAEVDELSMRTLAEINADVAFLGTNGISFERGLTTPDPAEAAIKRAMTGAARQRILLADHSKFGEVRTCQHATLNDIDLLITDAGADSADVDRVREDGTEIKVIGTD